jgi:hypothetical protein
MTQAVTIRLPDDLYEQLRRESFETRQSMNEITARALRLRFGYDGAETYGDLCNLFEAAWHHVVPESLDDVLPVTSKEARQLALLATEAVGQAGAMSDLGSKLEYARCVPNNRKCPTCHGL